MYYFILTLHVILSALLVLIILMQPGKGGDVSAAFAGGSSTQLFGAAGPGNFLTRGTGLIAALFMVTSIALALHSDDSARSGGGDVKDVMDEVMDEGEAGSGFGTNAPTEAAPSAPAAPAATPDAAPAAPAGAPVAPSPSSGAAPVQQNP